MEQKGYEEKKSHKYFLITLQGVQTCIDLSVGISLNF